MPHRNHSELNNPVTSPVEQQTSLRFHPSNRTVAQSTSSSTSVTAHTSPGTAQANTRRAESSSLEYIYQTSQGRDEMQRVNESVTPGLHNPHLMQRPSGRHRGSLPKLYTPRHQSGHQSPRVERLASPALHMHQVHDHPGTLYEYLPTTKHPTRLNTVYAPSRESDA